MSLLAFFGDFSLLYLPFLLVLIPLFNPSHSQQSNETCVPSQGDNEIPIPFSPTPNDNFTLSCGDSFTARTGGIFHKPFEKVPLNERCVWTIGVPNAKGYDITVNFMGWHPTPNNEEGYGLIISDFGRGRAPRHHIPTTSDINTITNSSMVMVTFFSGNESSTFLAGFILQYRARMDGILEPTVAATSRHAILGAESFYNRYTSTGPGQLSSFVFLPEDNIFRPGKDNRVVYNYLGFYDCRYDQLKIYFFNTTCIGAHKWEYQGRLCRETQAELIKSPEPILILFESIHTVTGSRAGFTFAYSAAS